MKNFKRIVMAALAVVVATAYSMPAQQAYAQSSASLSITPKKSYVVEPGKSIKDKLTIRNLDNTSDLNLTLRVVDFSFTDDGGTPKLLLDPNAEKTTWSLRSYLTVPKSVTIPKGSSKTLDMNLNIPKGHGAGSLYSAVIYSSAAPDGGGNVGLNASGVTLVFAQIPGKVNEDLKLEKFGAYKEATVASPAQYIFFSTEEPQRIAYTLKNNGNVTEAPVGGITLQGWFGAPITIENVNPSGSLALIGQSRTYTTCIKLKEAQVNFEGRKTEAKTCEAPGLWPGMYTVSLDLYYGQNGNLTKEIKGTGVFWYLPWWFIIIVLVVLAITLFYGWKLYNWVRSKLGRQPRSIKRSSRRK